MDTRTPDFSPFLTLFNKSDVSCASCPIKAFMVFYKKTYGKNNARFSFAKQRASFIPTMTIKENICLESIPMTVSDNKGFSLESYIEKLGNAELLAFYHQIILINEMPNQVDDQTLKMASLLQALLQNKEVLFLHRPESLLESEALELLIKILSGQARTQKRKIFISSENKKLWLPFAKRDFIITKCDQKRKWLITEESLIHSMQSVKNFAA